MNGISALIRDVREILSLHHVRTQQEGSSLQARKQVLTRTPPYCGTLV